MEIPDTTDGTEVTSILDSVFPIYRDSMRAEVLGWSELDGHGFSVVVGLRRYGRVYQTRINVSIDRTSYVSSSVANSWVIQHAKDTLRKKVDAAMDRLTLGTLTVCR